MEKYINEIICGDNLEVLREFPEECVDLTVTSPPYDNLRTYNGFDWDFEGIAAELYRVTKDGGVVVWVVGDATVNGSETGSSFRQALYFMGCGFNIHDTMIYQKQNPMPRQKNRYEQAFEYMFILSKGKPKTHNLIRIPCVQRGGVRMGTARDNNQDELIKNETTVVGKTKIKPNVWIINSSGYATTKDKIAFQHPAIFPEQLANDHIISWSNPGDIVLDPFIGSGTTAKMAALNGRDYIGIDISEEYCEIARRRVSDSIIKARVGAKATGTKAETSEGQAKQ